MTAFPNYAVGTVSVNATDTTVVGSGTVWSGVNARPGDLLQIGGLGVFISDVTDVTHLVIPPWGGSNQAAASYKIFQTSPLRFAGGQAMADVSALIAAINANGFIVFVAAGAGAPDNSLGEDGQYATDQANGLWWKKIAGVWTSTAGPLAGYGGTSTTSLSISIDSPATKVFTTQANLAYNGARVRAASAANPANYMEGVCTYSGTTLTMTVDAIGGTGTHTDWVFSIAGQPGSGGGSGTETFALHAGIGGL